MFVLRAALREALLADAVLAQQLNFVPDTEPPDTRRAVYINHLSQFRKINYPAISIFMDGGVDAHVLFADDIVVSIDVWTSETADIPGVAYGATGADALYRRCRALLHQAQYTAIIPRTTFSVQRFAEIDSSRMEDFDFDQKLFHIATRYRARLIEADAELLIAN